jgi:predicted GH43/DUF377 family glycosyl hydrolase
MIPFQLKRLGIVMEPDPNLPSEVEGVLNPGVARGPDGKLYLLPRCVGHGNHSEIGITRVKFDAAGDPVGVERLGIALKPETEYETWPDGRGGCEDPRISFVEPLNHYVMTYTAWSQNGPRIAIARSPDLFRWERLGLAHFTPFKDVPIENVDDKDAVIFPAFIEDAHGAPSVAMLHRPLFPGTRPEDMARPQNPRPIMPELESIWISYWHWRTHPEAPAAAIGHQFVAHRRLARPTFAWEALKIGSGAPPILCRHGWLFVYHGVKLQAGSTQDHHKYSYSAGVMILDRRFPHRILYRSPEPILSPQLAEEIMGTVDGVVFPTGIDRRDDLGQPDRFDVYYGMADNRIGAATLIVPETLPPCRIEPDQGAAGLFRDATGLIAPSSSSRPRKPNATELSATP